LGFDNFLKPAPTKPKDWAGVAVVVEQQERHSPCLGSRYCLYQYIINYGAKLCFFSLLEVLSGSTAAVEPDIVLGGLCGLLGGLLTPERPKKVELLIWAKIHKYRLAKLAQVAVSLEEAGCQMPEFLVA
jgi:hypothetical protein